MMIHPLLVKRKFLIVILDVVQLFGIINYSPSGYVTSNSDYSNYISWKSYSPDSIAETAWKIICEKE